MDNAIHHKCDLSRPSDLKILFSKEQSLKCTDFLINSAAINYCKPSQDISIKEWEEVFSVNLTSLFVACQSVLPYMMSKNSGKIVNISSIAGRNKSLVSGLHYTSSKAAIIGLTRQLASEFAAFGININVVCPGQTKTEMLSSSMNKFQLQNLEKAIPQKRVATTIEQSNVILFLCSELASYINGAAIDVNGGMF